jgi:uncharacterized coiled-coil protein SlyX
MLRNLAIRNVHTSHFLLIDFDFWPSDNLYSEILRQRNHFMNKKMMAVVVPAFERVSMCKTISECNRRNSVFNTPFMPTNLSSLIDCFSKKKCTIFHSKTFPAGHSSTDSSKWMDTSSTWLHPNPIKCFQSSQYEPYIVLSKSSITPKYDERFLGYGQNKRQFNEHLRHIGFSFEVLPRAFLIHFPHEQSEARTHPAFTKNDALYSGFACYLAHKYQNPPTPLCRPSSEPDACVHAKTLNDKLDHYQNIKLPITTKFERIAAAQAAKAQRLARLSATSVITNKVSVDKTPIKSSIMKSDFKLPIKISNVTSTATKLDCGHRMSEPFDEKLNLEWAESTQARNKLDIAVSDLSSAMIKVSNLESALTTCHSALSNAFVEAETTKQTGLSIAAEAASQYAALKTMSVRTAVEGAAYIRETALRKSFDQTRWQWEAKLAFLEEKIVSQTAVIASLNGSQQQLEAELSTAKDLIAFQNVIIESLNGMQRDKVDIVESGHRVEVDDVRIPNEQHEVVLAQ